MRSLHEFEHTDRYIDEEVRYQVQFKRLWVAGSYARGAITCADLDVIIDYETAPSHGLSARRVIKESVGLQRVVSYYGGTPKRNDSQVPLSEAVLVWAPGLGVDWKAAIASIKEDPTATRFKRKSDLLPLQLDQLRNPFGQLNTLVRLKEEGVLDWTLLERDSTPVSPASLGKLSRVETLMMKPDLWSGKSLEVMPTIVSHLRARAPHEHYIPRSRNEPGLDYAGVRIAIGNAWVDHEALERLAFSRLLIAPHLTRRGSNGLWEIRRGPNHPLNLAAADLGAYLLMTDAGHPVIDIRTKSWQTAHVMRIFDTHAGAQLAIDKALAANRKVDGAISYLQGAELVDALSYGDVLEIVDQNSFKASFALTHTGRHFVKGDAGEDGAHLSHRADGHRTRSRSARIRLPELKSGLGERRAWLPAGLEGQNCW